MESATHFTSLHFTHPAAIDSTENTNKSTPITYTTSINPTTPLIHRHFLPYSHLTSLTRAMTDYSKWDDMAREEERAEQLEKERKRHENREKYYRDQEERKVKYMKEQEAKKVSHDTANKRQPERNHTPARYMLHVITC